MTLPKLTPKQHTILILLYRYRFLNRIQIQRLMSHKDYKRINVWLADLRAKQYLEWIYSTDFLEKSKPAIYYLGLNGIRWLKQNHSHPAGEYHKRYRESARSRGFIDQSLLVADCCLAIEAKASGQAGSGLIDYHYVTQADYADPASRYYFLSDGDSIHPQLYYTKTIGVAAGSRTTSSYLLEVFEATLPRYRVRHRLKRYIEYFEDGGWQDDTDTDQPNPVALFVCPTLPDLIYCKRATKSLLEEKEGESIVMRFTTQQKLQAQGLMGLIWEEVRAPDED